MVLLLRLISSKYGTRHVHLLNLHVDLTQWTTDKKTLVPASDLHCTYVHVYTYIDVHRRYIHAPFTKLNIQL